GIPLGIHQETGIHTPELIFGNMRTSSNYDDTEEKTWGGRNGIGAKAANIFSTKFIIEACTDKHLYTQMFENGLTIINKPSIKKYAKKDYVKITYYPDFKAFGMTDFESNSTIDLIKKYCYDIAGVTTTSVKIHLNGNKIEINNFQTYGKLYTD